MENTATYREKEKMGNLGGKAGSLTELKKLGFNVPAFTVVPSSVLNDLLPDSMDENTKNDVFDKLVVPAGTLQHIHSFFGNDVKLKTYAVRSSATDEDGKQNSFAGQYETHLNVAHNELEEKILAIWKSVGSGRVTAYRKKFGMQANYNITVIVQEMINAEVSGVAFGADPVSGDLHTKIISSVYGMGEGLVSGELNADTFKMKEGDIEESIVEKTEAYRLKPHGSGIEKSEVTKKLQNLPSLNHKQIVQISTLLDQLNAHFNHPQDIEFAFAGDTLYLLQSRPITTLHNKEYILWDNSNIIESYPGVTTPLTFSFIIKMYEMVYRQFVGIMGVTEKEKNRHSHIFANTLGLVRGRVYYNLLSWYKMLAMLPGYSLNAQFMEKMMGVKERFELEEEFRMGKGMARLRIVTMILNMIRLQWKLPATRRSFLTYLNKVILEYRQINFNILTTSDIIKKYNHFETNLLLKWKAPLINDFFAMIWFGILQKITSKHCPEQPNIHNDLLCGSNDIISVEPIHMTMNIASLIAKDSEALGIFKTAGPDVIWHYLHKNNKMEILNALHEYLQKFGERCVGELKLETRSYSQHPELYIKLVKSYIVQGITSGSGQPDIENELRLNAEKEMKKAIGKKFITYRIFKKVLKFARDLVSNRENLRYERTRGFGMVRTMFTALGEKWHQDGHLENTSDVFYLELDEIKTMNNGHFDTELITKINERKARFAAYKEQPVPMDRFYTYGTDFTDEFIYSTEKLEPVKNDLQGIGCCPGRVQGKVQVITDPNSIESLHGDILVTTSTDPGWVTLFPTTSAILVERGSLLSHSAIVSREMGIPCIVGITGLLRSLKTGDEIVMDGATGKIQKLSL